MGSYRYGKQAVASKQQSSVRTFWKVTSITILLLVPVVVYIVLTTLPPSPVTGKTIDKGTFDPFTTVKTEWFSFKVEKTWQSVPELTKNDKVYTYREMQGPNPQGLLQIFINNSPKSTENYFTHVVPVSVKDGRSFLAKDLQPDCSTNNSNKLAQNFITMTQADTTFLCWIGSPIFYAVAGEIGGNSTIKMKREDGSEAEYIITYRNLAFIPSESTFPKVLDTFKSL